MAYEPTIWKKGDIISSTKLNKLENGLANVESGGGIVLHVVIDESTDDIRLDKTFGEIKEALLAGKSVVVYDSDNLLICPIILTDMPGASGTKVIYTGNIYEIYWDATSGGIGSKGYTAYSYDDYPTQAR